MLLDGMMMTILFDTGIFMILSHSEGYGMSGEMNDALE